MLLQLVLGCKEDRRGPLASGTHEKKGGLECCVQHRHEVRLTYGLKGNLNVEKTLVTTKESNHIKGT